jgi:hypothetical protein
MTFLNFIYWKIKPILKFFGHVHLEYVILIAFPRQRWLRERTSMLMLTLYEHFLSCSITKLLIPYPNSTRQNISSFDIRVCQAAQSDHPGVLKYPGSPTNNVPVVIMCHAHWLAPPPIAISLQSLGSDELLIISQTARHLLAANSFGAISYPNRQTVKECSPQSGS